MAGKDLFSSTIEDLENRRAWLLERITALQTDVAAHQARYQEVDDLIIRLRGTAVFSPPAPRRKPGELEAQIITGMKDEELIAPDTLADRISANHDSVRTAMKRLAKKGALRVVELSDGPVYGLPIVKAAQ